MICKKRIAELKHAAQAVLELDEKIHGFQEIGNRLAGWERVEPARGVLELIAEIERLTGWRPKSLPRGAGCCTKLRALEAEHRALKIELSKLRSLAEAE